MRANKRNNTIPKVKVVHQVKDVVKPIKAQELTYGVDTKVAKDNTTKVQNTDKQVRFPGKRPKTLKWLKDI